MFSISISWNITESSDISFFKTYDYIISMNTSPKHMYHRNQSSWAISFTISQTVVVSPKRPRNKRREALSGFDYWEWGMEIMYLAVSFLGGFHMCNHWGCQEDRTFYCQVSQQRGSSLAPVCNSNIHFLVFLQLIVWSLDCMSSLHVCFSYCWLMCCFLAKFWWLKCWLLGRGILAQAPYFW